MWQILGLRVSRILVNKASGDSVLHVLGSKYTPPPSQPANDGFPLEFLLKGPQTELRTLSQNCEQTLQKLRTDRVMNKRAFLRNVWGEEIVPENAPSKKILQPSTRASGLLSRRFLYRRNRATSPEGDGKRTVRGVRNPFFGGVSFVRFSSPLFFPPPHGVLWIGHSLRSRANPDR